MKNFILVGIVVAWIVGIIVIFASVPSDTWQDKRTEFGVASPDENQERIDCLSSGGTWESNSCSIVKNITSIPSIDCSGTARCIIEKVMQIIDGDTIYTTNHKIRLSLTDTPEKNEPRFQEAKSFTSMHCPVGSMITIDQDDLQPYDVYGRMLGKVYCDGGVINEILLSNGLGTILTRYCDTSEFSAESWVQKYGCGKPVVSLKTIPDDIGDCDSSYPDFCIASYPPDLDCGDIPHKRFTVLPPDPHRFDGDKDGVGCEK